MENWKESEANNIIQCRQYVSACSAWLEAEFMIMLEVVFMDIVWMSAGMVSFDCVRGCYLPVLWFTAFIVQERLVCNFINITGSEIMDATDK